MIFVGLIVHYPFIYMCQQTFLILIQVQEVSLKLGALLQVGKETTARKTYKKSIEQSKSLKAE